MALGDERLKKHAKVLMERLSAKPTASIPMACPPTVNQVLRLIATLGGLLVRKGDGEPGVETI